jgi:hypothetical protein
LVVVEVEEAWFSTDHFRYQLDQATASQWATVEQQTPMDKVLQVIQVGIQCLLQSLLMVVVVVAVGTAKQHVLVDQVVVDAQDLLVLDLMVILVQTTVATPIWEAKVSLEKDFREAAEYDLIVKAKTVTKQAVVVAQEALDSVLRMTATKDAWVKVVRVQLMTF